MKTGFDWARGNGYFRDADYSPALGSSLWASCPLLALLQDPSVGYTYHNDFFDYTAGDWTVTEVGTGSRALGDAAGGALVVTNAAADDDTNQLQKTGEAFKFATGKPCWFEARLKVSDPTQADLLVGLAITDTTLIGGNTDGANFRLTDGSAALSFVTEKNSTETTTAAVATLVANTYVRLGIFFDGAGSVYAYVDGVLVATHTTNVCDDEELRISFAHQNGEAVAKVLTIDFVRCCQIR